MSTWRHELSHLTDPAATLSAIDELCPLRVGRTIVAAVELKSQEVVGARVLHTGDRIVYHLQDRGSDLVRSTVEEMLPDRTFDPAAKQWSSITHTFVTVVCREGRVIDTEREWAWHHCWRYANHFRPAFDGDVFVVTPDGWTGCFDRRAGFEPRLRPRLSSVA